MPTPAGSRVILPLADLGSNVVDHFSETDKLMPVLPHEIDEETSKDAKDMRDGQWSDQ